MFATVKVIVGEDASTPAVPIGAVIYEREGAHVWAVNTDRSVELRPVSLGLSNDRLIQVLAGLRARENHHEGQLVHRPHGCGSAILAGTSSQMQAIVELALKQRLLTVILFVMTLVGGVAAFRVLNIEAYPDPVPRSWT